ncbi:hypothetical protein RHSIM_Rhsim12G0139800 [Rhododendron simsii]|uniref:Exonuclease 1 n=1 Tax=Rhododendron simsii TaxID=118357 RepID=A0A834L7Y2_RHOSS|nr:hypothetical protein RHSIM_Rhsim12G0139800 [Rhododendron simsii]
MGIKDLLRFMKPYIEPIHIKKYAGKRVGIDAYSWLHKGAYSCSMEICLNTEGDKKFQYLNYFIHRINLLRHHNIVPVVVFDGGDISCKDATGQERSRKRKANLDLAMEKLKEGNRNAASELFQVLSNFIPFVICIVGLTSTFDYGFFCTVYKFLKESITNAHFSAFSHVEGSEYHTIHGTPTDPVIFQILRSEDIEFVVAPYEADAQLAYLSSLEPENGGIIAVISEDSDLLAYGCPAIVFKMDRYGNGEEIVLHKVFESATCVPSFRHFDKELFIGMCVLAGCDFLPSVPGIGIAKAYSLVSKYRDLDRVLSMLKFEKGRQMPEDYPESFRKAVAVFQHARIYDADSESLKHMKPLPEKLSQSLDGDLDFLGPYPFILSYFRAKNFVISWGEFREHNIFSSFSLNKIRDIPPSIAAAIAKGNLDPTTMEAFDHFPSSRPHMNPSSKIQTFGTLSRQEATAVSKAESCFSIISSHKTGKEKSKGKLLNFAVMGKKATVEKSNYFNEATELEKLVCPLKTAFTEETKASSGKIPLKVPGNNPFRKRKYAEVQLDELEIVAEQVSVVAELERSEISFVTPESQQSVESKPIRASDRSGISFVTPESHQSVEKSEGKLLYFAVMGKKAMVEKSNYFNEATELEKLVCPLKTPFTEENKASSDKIPLKVPENNTFRKRKYAEVQLDELEIVAEQVSVVTELERSGISFVTPESQQSVDSKPIRASDRSEISFMTPESHQSVDSKPLRASDGKKVKNEKLKRSNCQDLESKKSSILNFFSRV